MIFQVVLSVSLQKEKSMQAPGYAFIQTSHNYLLFLLQRAFEPITLTSTQLAHWLLWSIAKFCLLFLTFH